MFVLDIVAFLAKWYHVCIFLVALGVAFRSNWRRLGETEQMVRDVMALSRNNPERENATRAIDKAQRAAIRAMRLCVLLAAGLLFIVLKHAV